MRTNGSHFSGSASSGKIASTGHSGSQAPQSMHSSGSITRMRSNSWMQSTGQTSTQDRSLMSMQGSAMMYVTGGDQCNQTQPSGRQLFDDLLRALVERRFRHHLIEAGGVCAAQAVRVGVVREAQDRDLRIGVGDLVRVDPRDVRDHTVGRVDALDGDQVMAGEQPLELPTEEEVDAHQQDRRHAANVAPAALVSNAVSQLETAVDLIRRGEYFAAHEELEEIW